MEYFNAAKYLPGELIEEVLRHLPSEARKPLLLYFSDDYYDARNAEIRKAFEIYLGDPQFSTMTQIIEHLAEEFHLCERRIWDIVRGTRTKRSAERRRGTT